MTLNQQADFIANTLNQPFNHELKERAKDLFKEQMALYIRRSIKEHGVDRSLVLSFPVEVVRVDKHDKPIEQAVKDGYKFRSKYLIPKAIRYSKDAPYLYVGTDDGLISFPFRLPMESQLMHLFSSTGEFYSYYVRNGYIYINDKPNHKFKGDYILVEDIFESPEEVIGFYEDEDGQDINLPFPNDIAAIIRGQVLQILGSMPIEDIKVEHNDNTPTQ